MAAPAERWTITDEDRAAAKEIVARAREAERARVAIARVDHAEFCRYTLRDERTGAPIENGPLHVAFHDLIAANDQVVIWSHIESGKTNQITIGEVLATLAQNPNARIAIVSKTERQARKFVRSIKRYIERSVEVRTLAPHLKPGEPWAAIEITVSRDSSSKDPSVQAVGTNGNIIGSRVDLVIVDDILSVSNTRTQRARDELEEWFQANIVGRVVEGGRIIVLGTAWHPDDLLHRLARRPGWVSRRFGVLDRKGRPTWPQRWSLRRIAQKRRALGPLEARRQLDCRAVADDERRFEDEWIARSIRNGDGLMLVPRIDPSELPDGAWCVTGIDVAAKKKRPGALTVFFTLLVYPNGDRQVVDVRAGRFTAPQIRDLALHVHDSFGSTIYVEDNGVQSWMIEIVGEERAIPIWPFTTGSNKWHPSFGVESLGVEMANGKWIVPSDDGIAEKPIRPFIEAMQAFDPQQHTPDHLMAAWIAREGARSRGRAQRRGSVGISVIGARA
jgi:hypothetical protein